MKGIITLKRPIEVAAYRWCDGAKDDRYEIKVKAVEGEFTMNSNSGVLVRAHTGYLAEGEGTTRVNLGASFSTEAQRLYDAAEDLRLAQQDESNSAEKISEAYRKVRDMPNEQRLTRSLIRIPAGNVDGIQNL